MKKLSIIVIIILTIISCSLIGIIIYQQNNYVKIPKQYKCETEEKTEENVTYKYIMIININKEQYIDNYQNKIINTYIDEELYNTAKTIENNEQITYTFDDTKKTLIADYGISNVTDSDGNNINIWYKDYIKNIEKSGFVCQMIK